jgi:hypothetical protein
MCFVFRSEENRRYFTAGTGMLGDALESGQKSLGLKMVMFLSVLLHDAPVSAA